MKTSKAKSLRSKRFEKSKRELRKLKKRLKSLFFNFVDWDLVISENRDKEHR